MAEPEFTPEAKEFRDYARTMREQWINGHPRVVELERKTEAARAIINAPAWQEDPVAFIDAVRAAGKNIPQLEMEATELRKELRAQYDEECGLIGFGVDG